MRSDSNWPTDCWRYEYPDGGGPWFYPNGKLRDSNNMPKFEYGSDVLYGCDTLEHLKQYMEERNIDTSQMYLIHYFDIECVQYNPRNGHVTFLKRGFE